MSTSSARPSRQELQVALTAPAPPLLVHVRSCPKYAAGHRQGERLIAPAEIEKRVGDLLRHQPMVYPCRSGQQFDEAASTVARLGFRNVGQPAGGMMAWEQAGLPVEKEAQVPWALKRPAKAGGPVARLDEKLGDRGRCDGLAQFAAGRVAHLHDQRVGDAVADEGGALLAAQKACSVEELELSGNIRLGGANGGEQFADVLWAVLEFLKQGQAGAVSEGLEDLRQPLQSNAVEFRFRRAFLCCHIRDCVYA